MASLGLGSRAPPPPHPSLLDPVQGTQSPTWPSLCPPVARLHRSLGLGQRPPTPPGPQWDHSHTWPSRGSWCRGPPGALDPPQPMGHRLLQPQPRVKEYEGLRLQETGEENTLQKFPTTLFSANSTIML